MEENKQMTKDEILAGMRHHGDEYAKLAAELKLIKQQEDKAAQEKTQLDRLEEFKNKYVFFADTKPQEDSKKIDWEEVEKLLRTTFGQDIRYALGWDETGMPGLGYTGNAHFHPMVEEEGDIRKYREREMKRQEILARRKKSE